MTEEQIMAFIAWLDEQGFSICGPVYSVLLGDYRDCPLHPDDYKLMIADFLKSQQGN